MVPFVPPVGGLESEIGEHNRRRTTVAEMNCNARRDIPAESYYRGALFTDLVFFCHSFRARPPLLRSDEPFPSIGISIPLRPTFRRGLGTLQPEPGSVVPDFGHLAWY